MTATAMTPERGAAPDVPHLDFDPFSIEFFADPFPTHEKLREAYLHLAASEELSLVYVSTGGAVLPRSRPPGHRGIPGWPGERRCG